MRKRDLLSRIDGHLRRGDDVFSRIDSHLERGDELFGRVEAALDRNSAAFDRNGEAFDRHGEAFERNMAAVSDLSEFIREQNTRAEKVTNRQIERIDKIAAGQDELIQENRAQRLALLALIDRLPPPRAD